MAVGYRSACPSSAPRRSDRSARPASRPGRVVKLSFLRHRLQSKPTCCSTPVRPVLEPVPSGFTREMFACVSGGTQMLHGAPMLKV